MVATRQKVETVHFEGIRAATLTGCETRKPRATRCGRYKRNARNECNVLKLASTILDGQPSIRHTSLNGGLHTLLKSRNRYAKGNGKNFGVGGMDNDFYDFKGGHSEEIG